jgi:regulator of protease activity HflC (stomatin/prohibitin superfamily)
MRKILEGLLILIFAFASVRAGLPWPIVFIVGLLALCRAGAFSFARDQRVNPNLFTTLALFLGIGLLISWWIAEYLNSVVPSVLAASSTPRLVRWFPNFFAGSDPAILFWSLMFGLGISALIVLIILQLASSVAAPMIYGSYDQYKGHEAEARHSVFASLLGRSNGTLQVSAGTATAVSGDAATLEHFGGPGTLIVQEGHAVILEKGGELSRIVGRGITTLDPFERISMVVPLQLRNDKVTVEQVATKDKILIDEFNVLVFHKVDPGPEAEQVRDGQAVYNRDNLISNVWKPTGGDLRGGVRSMTESAVRDVVGRYNLEDIVPIAGDFRESFKKEVMREINKVTKTLMGIEVKAVDFGKIKPPPEAEKRLQAKWLADWDVRIARSERDAMIRRGEAGAVLLKVKEVAWAEAQREIIQRVTEGFREVGGLRDGQQVSYVIALRALETLEKMAGDPATKILLPNDVLLQLNELRAALAGTQQLGLAAQVQPVAVPVPVAGQPPRHGG